MNTTRGLSVVEDNYPTALRKAIEEESKHHEDGEITLVRDGSGKNPVNINVWRWDVNRPTAATRLWRKMTDALWGPLREERRALYSEENIAEWTYLELARPARDGRSCMKSVVEDLLPSKELSSASFTHITLDGMAHAAAFDAWLGCPDLRGPFHSSKLNRDKTRIRDGQLFLVFNMHGAEFEFRFHARDAFEAGGPRGARDLQRLYRVATDKKASYRNLSELVTAFLSATVEDEAPRMLEACVRQELVAKGHAADQRAFLVAQRNGKLFPVAERAVRIAIDRCMGECRNQVSLLGTWVRTRDAKLRAGKKTDTLLPDFCKALKALQVDFAAMRDRARRDGGTELDLSQKSIHRQIALPHDTAEALRLGQPVGGIAVIRYAKPTKLWDGLLTALGIRPPSDERRHIVIEAASTASLSFPSSREQGTALLSALGISKQPKTTEKLAEALAQTPFDTRWRMAALERIGSLVSSSEKPELQAALLGPVRYGKSTFADLEYGAAACNQSYGGPVSHGSSRVADEASDEIRLAPAPLEPRIVATSRKDALCKALFARLQGNAPPSASIGDVPEGQLFWFDANGKVNTGDIKKGDSAPPAPSSSSSASSSRSRTDPLLSAV